jgi:phage-related protein
MYLNLIFPNSGNGLTFSNSRVTFLLVKRQIQLYETESGGRPVEKFLNKLDRPTRDKIAAATELIETGEELPSHLFCKMTGTDDLWEIRIKHNTNIHRFLSFFDGSKLIIVAHGFQKKTQKTPEQEIKTAEQRKKNYFKRKI